MKILITLCITLVSSLSYAGGKYSSKNFVICAITNTSWTQFSKTGIYSPDSLSEEGFIHFSKPDQLKYVMNKYLTADSYVLAISSKGKLGKGLVYESTGALAFYPHLYRPLLFEELITTISIVRNHDGTFSLPEEFRL
ncbi:MAG: DUF952 domain-containing protein [Bacteriovoracaceae bacterium]|jgi:uncharacterized protein (DUF952 family)|nr:DUF952 domain-containing protein [Bacteriovoracaceae bacterium]